MKEYYFKEKHAFCGRWIGPFKAINVCQAFHQMMAEKGCDDYSWRASRDYWLYRIGKYGKVK